MLRRSLLFGLLVACGSAPPPPPRSGSAETVSTHSCAKLITGERDVIYGRLLDAATHEPIVGGTVVVEEDLPVDDALRRDYEPGLTDADGCFAFGVKRAGRITVVAYYADVTQRAVIDRKANEPAIADLEMSIPPDPDEPAGSATTPPDR